MQGNHKLSGAACQISMFQTWDLNYTASNFIFITSVWIRIVTAIALARHRDTKPRALRTPRSSVCEVIITNFEFNYKWNSLILCVKFSSVKAYENKPVFCSCKDGKIHFTGRSAGMQKLYKYKKWERKLMLWLINLFGKKYAVFVRK